MGEWSKKLGEHGEDIVESLLKLIGWHSSIKGTDIDCFKQKEHGKDGSLRKQHGIDFIFSSSSPLEDDLLRHLLVSSKFSSKPYPNSPSSTFKSHIIDLATAIESKKKSETKKRINKSYQNVNSDSVSGVLFWINSADDPSTDIVQQVCNVKGIDDFPYGTIYVIDNYRASFLYDTIIYARSSFGKENYRFLYPSTGKNIGTSTRLTSGEILPAEYLNSGIIPFHIETDKKKTLLICCQENFSENTLKRLIGFSMAATLEFANEVIIAFPDYEFTKHKQDVDIAKACLANKKFASTIKVSSYKSDFRGSEE